MNIHVRLLLLTIASSLLLWLGWPPLPFPILLFFALVPLLELELQIEKYKLPAWKYFLSVYVSMVLWNIGTTYWIYYTTVSGAVLIHLINPMLLSLPFLIYRWIKRRAGQLSGYIAFAGSWISLEYFHYHWPLAFPFLTLGNGLSTYPAIVQFYEYTGVLGGSAWILAVNVSIFETFRQKKYALKTKALKEFLTPVMLALVPAIISLVIYYSYQEKGKPVEVVALHPNVDCRNEKYIVDVDRLIQHYWANSSPSITHDTDYIVWPETAITNARWIEEINENKMFDSLRSAVSSKNPKAKLITGAVLYETFDPDTNIEKPEDIPNLRFNDQERFWYYTYNAAFQVSGNDPAIPIHTKSKLVPMEETTPAHLGFLRKMVASLGGFSFSTRGVNADLFHGDDGVAVTPLICYESIFSNVASSYARKGAQLFFVILNEGWYKNMTGASQFMYYSSVRAIENRRAIARSSNDGISCFINQKGDIEQITKDFKPMAIKSVLLANRVKTLYHILGDYIGIIGTVATGCVIFYSLLRSRPDREEELKKSAVTQKRK